MGTRADFYLGRGVNATWLGSIAWDGYPDGITPKLKEVEEMWPGGPLRNKGGEWEEGKHFFDAQTETQFIDRLKRFFKYRSDVTLPVKGWPWPWEDSRTTDYAYAFDGGKVYASCFGGAWVDPKVDYDGEEYDELGPKPIFPDMRRVQNVTFGERSGVIVVTAK